MTTTPAPQTTRAADFPRDICLRLSDNFDGDDVRVIVVLAGWMGCRDRALSKYAGPVVILQMTFGD